MRRRPISDDPTFHEKARDLVHRVVDGDSPAGREFDACRAVVRADAASDSSHAALTMLLEGCLADPRLPIDDTQVLVRVLKALARRELTPGDLL